MADQPAPERTSGSEIREARSLMEAVEVFDLRREIEDLVAEPNWADDRNSRTLAKEENLRILLVALKAGAELGTDEAHGRMSLQVLRGQVAVSHDGQDASLCPGQLAALDVGGKWSVRAIEDSAVLLTICWPEERAVT